ncbi:MAG: tetratricopeptide repeat protein [Acidisphaera sp.]|nr:tetratricopeptide repeat protein [Acidisphaera sp.]
MRVQHDPELRVAEREKLADDLHEAGRAAEAVAVLAPLVRANPERISARVLMAICLADSGHIDPALGMLQDTAARAPECAAAWSNLGMLLKIEGRFDEAVAAADRAVALQPDHAQLRLNRAVALLRAGRLAEAWPDYEWRLRVRSGPGLPLERLLPDIASLGAGNGRTVLVLHEEGFGDTLQFVRYVPLLAQRGFRVVVCVPRELAALIRTVGGVAELLTPDAAVPDYDFHCPFFSLPRAFATSLATIPAVVPYLSPPADRVALWRARISPLPGLRIGLVWAGQARPWLPGFVTLDARRSLRLDDLAPLGPVPGVSFVSLQKGGPAAQAATPPAGLTLLDPMSGVVDFAETAAIVANLDVVVSVDTSVAHLAGALGKPVFLLDRYDSCWRWLSGRTDSPWYPGMRIFRQRTPGAWGSVLAEVANELHAWARERNGGAIFAPPSLGRKRPGEGVPHEAIHAVLGE